MARRLGVSGWKPCCCSFKLCPEWLGTWVVSWEKNGENQVAIGSLNEHLNEQLWYVVVRYAVKPEKAGVWGLNKKVQG
jgi:hypothetical protein